MHTTIIHRPQRTDREPFLLPLLRFFRDVRIMDACVPQTTEDPASRAVRGCSASHLLAIEQSDPNRPLLVLEDDAVLDESLYRKVQALGDAPRDCGAILLGGDGLPNQHPWNRVTARYFGSQAVLYLPALKQSRFVSHAWKLLALHETGIECPGAVRLCYESLLQQSVLAAGLHLYAPMVLPFATGTSFSDRLQAEMPGRDGSIPTETTTTPS
jgi:hypothetical protein